MSHVNKTIAGRYVLKDLIGQGGMADVYLADDKILKRTVAVKIMRSSLTGDPVYVTRFHREASAAAALSHKNIVEIYDVGDEEDDYYIVMEYVPGQTLKELIRKRGALHFVEAVDIMRQVVSATAKAHSMGIVHRDLKPQNIMVTDSGVVKIGDFGIASIQSLSQVTQTDTIMGSLHYLAPEIARGEKATSQSDIYALGIVFYELLRGEVPFNGESPVNIALKHMRDDIPSVRTFNPSIPQSVENIIIKATAKNIQDRYQYANDMLEDLMTCLTRDNEEKLVFDYHDGEESATIVAEEKDFFTQTQMRPTPIEEEVEEVKKTIDKKKIAIIGGCVAGALLIFLLIYFIFLKPADTIKLRDVRNMTKEEAITILTDEGFKVDDVVKQEVSDDAKWDYHDCLMLGDKGYLSAEVQQDLFETAHIKLEVPYRLNQKNWRNPSWAYRRFRKRIETVFSQLNDQFMMVRNYAKQTGGLFTRTAAKIAAMTVLQYINFCNHRKIGLVKDALF